MRCLTGSHCTVKKPVQQATVRPSSCADVLLLMSSSPAHMLHTRFHLRMLHLLTILANPLIYVNIGLLCYHCRINSLTKECITLFTFNGEEKKDQHITLSVLLILNNLLVTQMKETSYCLYRFVLHPQSNLEVLLLHNREFMSVYYHLHSISFFSFPENTFLDFCLFKIIVFCCH